MSRLIVVSNRVADPQDAAPGGLAVALQEAMQRRSGVWFGWSGEVTDNNELRLSTWQSQGLTMVTTELEQRDHESFYQGYCNKILWPVFHNRLDLAEFEGGFWEGYERVNAQFARQLLPLLKEDDLIWVHDYHLIGLARQLRALGCRQKIGFFLHIPFPPAITFMAVPQHKILIQDLLTYDLIGLQSNQDLRHFESYIIDQAGGEEKPTGDYKAYGRQSRCKVFPIGIDAHAFAALTHESESRQVYETMQREYSQQRLVLGIDRLDYSKGLPERIHAFRDLLSRHSHHLRSATLIQIGSPTRENLQAYAEIRAKFESLCGSINGDLGELDWMPVRYIHQVLTRSYLAGLCRCAAVGLVTPLRDGMNLVAKEFVAAQDPLDPGVLVLSQFAGAAEQMSEALLVNPHDIQATANTINQALQMARQERIDRHGRLLERIKIQDVYWWCSSFLAVLTECPIAIASESASFSEFGRKSCADVGAGEFGADHSSAASISHLQTSRKAIR